MPVITPPGFHPAVELRADGRLHPARDTLAARGDAFASGLELAAIAIDDAPGRFAHAPLAWQRRLVEHARRRALARPRALRTASAIATVLLDVFEHAPRLRAPALDGYLALLERTRDVRLHDSMTMNLDRVRGTSAPTREPRSPPRARA